MLPALLAVLLILLAPTPALALREGVPAAHVRSIPTSAWSPSSPDPAGIAYLPATDEFLVSDSEVEELPTYADFNLFTNARGALVGTGTGRSRPARNFSFNEPAGLAYDPVADLVYVSDDDADRIFMLQRGPDGRHGTSDDDLQRLRFSTGDFGSFDPEGVEYDPATGHLFVCDGSALEIFEIEPVNGFDSDVANDPTPDDDIVTSFDIGVYGMRDCEGLGLDPGRATLLAVDPVARRIFELTKAGALKRIVDLSTMSQLATSNPAAVVVAPTSDPADDPAARSYWVADRQVDESVFSEENDGLLHELLVPSAEPPVEAPVSVDDASVPEAELVASVTIERPDGGLPGTVRVTTTPDTAAAGSDYTPIDEVVSFTTGQTAATVAIPLAQDGLDESDETLSIVLSDATGDARVDLAPPETVTIVDSDPEPVLTLADAVANEGNSAADEARLTFEASLSAVSGRDVRVGAAVELTGASAADVETVLPDLKIPAGATTARIVVPIVEDQDFEAAEELVVRLSDPEGAILARDAATGRIDNDDAAPPSEYADVLAELRIAARQLVRGATRRTSGGRVRLGRLDPKTYARRLAICVTTTAAPRRKCRARPRAVRAGASRRPRTRLPQALLARLRRERVLEVRLTVVLRADTLRATAVRQFKLRAARR